MEIEIEIDIDANMDLHRIENNNNKRRDEQKREEKKKLRVKNLKKKKKRLFFMTNHQSIVDIYIYLPLLFVPHIHECISRSHKNDIIKYEHTWTVSSGKRWSAGNTHIQI